MLTNVLLLLILVALLLVLWALLQKRSGAGGKPDKIHLPHFPIPRPKSDFIEPPRQEVKIRFDDREGAVRIEPAKLVLAPNKQLAVRRGKLHLGQWRCFALGDTSRGRRA